MIAHEHGAHAGVAPQQMRDRVLPDLDRTPGPPGEVEGADEQIVTGRHAGQRTRDMVGEAHGPCGQAVEVRGVELRAAVGPEHVTVQAVEQDHDDIANDNALVLGRGGSQRAAAGHAGQGGRAPTVGNLRSGVGVTGALAAPPDRLAVRGLRGDRRGRFAGDHDEPDSSHRSSRPHHDSPRQHAHGAPAVTLTIDRRGSGRGRSARWEETGPWHPKSSRLSARVTRCRPRARLPPAGVPWCTARTCQCVDRTF